MDRTFATNDFAFLVGAAEGVPHDGPAGDGGGVGLLVERRQDFGGEVPPLPASKIFDGHVGGAAFVDGRLVGGEDYWLRLLWSRGLEESGDAYGGEGAVGCCLRVGEDRFDGGPAGLGVEEGVAGEEAAEVAASRSAVGSIPGVARRNGASSAWPR